MGVRRAFVNWQKFDKNSDLVNKQLYMVCEAMDGNAGSLNFAHYYEKGTVVEIKIDDMYKIAGQEPSAEERLLRALFGNHKSYVIPEDGFYLITGDYGVDEKEANGAFEGCCEQAVCIGTRNGWTGEGDGAIPVYWAELPVLPDGRAYFGETAWCRPRKESVPESGEDLYEKIQADPVLAGCYRSICRNAVPGDANVDYGAGAAVYSVSPYSIASACAGIHTLAGVLAGIPEDEFLKLHEEVAAADLKTARCLMESFFQDHGFPSEFRWMTVHYISALRDAAHDFYYCRDKRLSEGGLRSLNVPAVLQEAWAMSTLPFRIARYVKLLGMGAPEIILVNELRVLVERFVAGKMGQHLVHVLPNFDEMFGVDPYGARGAVRCAFGDKELELIQEDGPSDADDGADPEEAEAMEEVLGCPCSGYRERKEPVVGVDVPFFAVVPAPNFLMRKCRFVLWDNTNYEYLKCGDGGIEQFQDWRSAKARSEELAAMAAGNR